MAFIPVQDCLAVRIFTGGTTTLWSNTLYYARPNYTFPEQQTLTEEVFDTWATGITASLDAQYQTRYAISTDLRSEFAPTYAYSPAPVAGTDVGEELPIQDAMVVTLRTIFRGRGGRGRLYIAGFNESALSSGMFAANDINNVMAMLLAVQVAANAAGFLWVIAHRYENGVPLALGEPRTVTSALVRSSIPGVQRRRSRRP